MRLPVDHSCKIIQPTKTVDFHVDGETYLGFEAVERNGKKAVLVKSMGEEVGWFTKKGFVGADE